MGRGGGPHVVFHVCAFAPEAGRVAVRIGPPRGCGRQACGHVDTVGGVWAASGSSSSSTRRTRQRVLRCPVGAATEIRGGWDVAPALENLSVCCPSCQFHVFLEHHIGHVTSLFRVLRRLMIACQIRSRLLHLALRLFVTFWLVVSTPSPWSLKAPCTPQPQGLCSHG